MNEEIGHRYYHEDDDEAQWENELLAWIIAGREDT